MAGMEVEPPSPDIHELFCHYNELYFHGALSACFVDWCPRATSSTGTCRYYGGGGCEIRISGALRKVHPDTDLKNVLLHEMIHAFLWIKCGNREHSSDHDSYFREKMKEINSSSVEDHQRPQGGYNVTIHHEFKKEVETYKYYHWICDTCGHMINKSREPSASDCNQKVGPDGSCNNSKCDWHNHKNGCPGSYTREPESPRYKDQNLDSRDVKRNSDNNSSFGDDNQKKVLLNPKQMSPVDLKTESRATAPQYRNGVKVAAQKSRKRTREDECKKGHIAASKWRECMKAYKTVGEWFTVYGEEEEHKDVEPLRNKRSERRKRLKLLQTHAENGSGVARGDGCSAPSVPQTPAIAIDLNQRPREAIPAEEAQDPQPRRYSNTVVRAYDE
ncbi:sprT-like domain-containing protein Spartan isoform X3 [Iris pallida]|uniref:SprT-like domain-containing protein Spartan isoform X3 n=1 Tax=Iris pallida TaxID=29817 RepID=A0AAX6I8I7_IRIPA|nr:sprT-like domain-containing protein Spartan isoform X3 [Iris pallida]